MDELIRVEHLCRDYGDQRAVVDLSFRLHRGEILGLLGPNGAGKTSTLQMITGNLAPSAGRIVVAGHDLLDRPRKAKRNIGYLPETPPLHNDMPVAGFLRYCARLHEIPRRRCHRAVSSAMERCGLADAGDRLIGNLSKGYRQRVGIAQAIVHEPDVVVLDEPTVGLDPIQIREIRQLIRDLGKDRGVILSTHILPEVQATCNRVQIIHNGSLILSKGTDQINDRLAASTLVARFNRAPDTLTLSTLPGISGVEQFGDNRYRLLFDPDHHPGEAVVKAAAANDWGLYELYPERRTLEQMFLRLTGADLSDEVTPVADRRSHPR